MPIYEYRCEECGKGSSALLATYASTDPACPHCGKRALHRLVSTFATMGSDEDGGLDDDFGAGGDDGTDFGGGGEDDFGAGDDDF